MNKSIVSLIASATEIVFALNEEKMLRGRSHGCDFPREVLSLPILTKATFPIDGSSVEIDSHVIKKLSDGLSVYEVDREQLAALSPDVIITQDQCEVCAASLRDVEEAMSAFLGKPAEIISLKPNRLYDVLEDIRKVAKVLGVEGRGEAVVQHMQSRIEGVKELSRNLEYLPKVVCIEWIEPLMAAGNWMPEIVEIAGGVNLFGQVGEHSPWMQWNDVVEADPDVILILPCGFDIERTMSEFDVLKSLPNWANLRAVKSSQVYVIDGDQYCNRPGPRLVESLEIIAEILHPKTYSFGHENEAWIRCEV